jgi:hypothetical protein
MPARTRVFLDALSAKFAGPECQAIVAKTRAEKAKRHAAADAATRKAGT